MACSLAMGSTAMSSLSLRHNPEMHAGEAGEAGSRRCRCRCCTRRQRRPARPEVVATAAVLVAWRGGAALWGGSLNGLPSRQTAHAQPQLPSATKRANKPPIRQAKPRQANKPPIRPSQAKPSQTEPKQADQVNGIPYMNTRTTTRHPVIIVAIARRRYRSSPSITFLFLFFTITCSPGAPTTVHRALPSRCWRCQTVASASIFSGLAARGQQRQKKPEDGRHWNP